MRQECATPAIARDPRQDTSSEVGGGGGRRRREEEEEEEEEEAHVWTIGSDAIHTPRCN